VEKKEDHCGSEIVGSKKRKSWKGGEGAGESAKPRLAANSGHLPWRGNRPLPPERPKILTNSKDSETPLLKTDSRSVHGTPPPEKRVHQKKNLRTGCQKRVLFNLTRNRKKGTTGNNPPGVGRRHSNRQTRICKEEGLLFL